MSAPLDVHEIRSCFPALDNYAWFQNGGVSITPSIVAEELAERFRELSVRGPMHIIHPEEELPRRERSLVKLVEFFQAPVNDLAVVRGVSEAFQVVLTGLPWRAGDEIIVTTDEEAALLLPVLHKRDALDVRVVKLPLHASAAEQLAEFERLCTDRTRLVAISHVTTDLGHRLPARDLCRAARRRGVLSFVDLAHSAGLFPISLPEMECDFAGIVSYKWMYGPYAAGLFYGRPESVERLDLTFAGGRSERTLRFEDDFCELHADARKFQYGPWCWPLVHAWAAAADWLTACGLDQIEARTRELTSLLKEQLRMIDGARLMTPNDWEASAALVTVELERHSGESVAQRLRNDHNMIVKPLPHSREGLRISVPFFLLFDELTQLAAALDSVLND